MTKLSKKSIKIWLFRNIILLILSLGAYILSIVLIDNEMVRKAISIPLGVIELIILIILISFPFLKYRYYNYSIDERRIIINRGIIFKHHYLIPVRQIQDLHLYQGPIMTIFNCSGVIISTAGSNYELGPLDKDISKTLVNDLEMNLNKRLDEKTDD